MIIKHHGIVYSTSNPCDAPIEELLLIVKKQGNNVVSGGLLNQCNGPITSTNHTNNLLVLIPVEYIEERGFTQEQLEKYIEICNKDTNFAITAQGVYYIPNPQLSHGLKQAYNKDFSENYYVFTVGGSDYTKVKNSAFKLAQFSLLRALYACSYEGYLEEVLRLDEKYPKIDSFNKLRFATINYKKSSSYCGGGYMPFYSTPKSINKASAFNAMFLPFSVDVFTTLIQSNCGQNSSTYNIFHLLNNFSILKGYSEYFLKKELSSQAHVKIRETIGGSDIAQFNKFLEKHINTEEYAKKYNLAIKERNLEAFMELSNEVFESVFKPLFVK